MRYLLLVVACATFLSGCGTKAYKPTEYPLREGLIPTFNIKGTVSITNAQPSSEQVIVYSYVGTKLASDLKTITEVMVQQAQKELQKSGEVSGAAGRKSIALKVNSLLSSYSGAFFWRSNIEFQATLGNGQTLDFNVPHKSGILLQDLNGCIAQGVLTLFKDKRVLAYLAR